MGIFTKLSKGKSGFQKELGEFLEQPMFTGIVILLILTDLTCTVINDTLENTELLNPKYDEQGEAIAKLTHNICVSVLRVFVVEQLGHLLAYGCAFFSNFWFVMDLFVVLLSLLCETVLEDSFEGLAPLLVVLRLWKVVGFIFDVFLSDHEDAERDETISKDYKKMADPESGKKPPAPKRPKVLMKMSKVKAENGGTEWQRELGEFMERPMVTGVVILLIITDLVCTAINDTLENTDLVNPKFGEEKEFLAKLTHNICVSVLCVFVVEQLCHLVAYGEAFFLNIWFVMDLLVVCLSLLCETYLEDAFAGLAPLLVVLRLWKVVGFVFDLFLSHHEDSERDEKLKAAAPKPTRETLRTTKGVLMKMSKVKRKSSSIWGQEQRMVGELLESPEVTGIVILLILVDLTCTAINDVLENTNLLNPVYHEQGEWVAGMTHTICVCVLCIFMVEQLGHLFAFGAAFFTNFWFVMDLVVVTLSLLCETLLEDEFHGMAPLLLVLRLWKVVGFIFDIFLADNEDKERDETIEKEDAPKPKERPPPAAVAPRAAPAASDAKPAVEAEAAAGLATGATIDEISLLLDKKLDQRLQSLTADVSSLRAHFA